MAETLRQGYGFTEKRASHPVLEHTEHRPWPVPRRPWLGRQSWKDLLFAHWRIPASALRRFVPPELEIQERDGSSWIGITPFRLTDLSVRWLPELPWVGRFLELNVRLYVERDGKPGIWFLSLDASSTLAVAGARLALNLPYVRANMEMTVDGEERRFWSTRPRAERARFRASYRPTGPVGQAAPGSLEHFLTERYCLYSRPFGGRVQRVEVHHPPWPLQDATAEVDADELFAAHQLPVSGPPELVHFARRVDVVIWPPERASRPDPS